MKNIHLFLRLPERLSGHTRYVILLKLHKILQRSNKNRLILMLLLDFTVYIWFYEQPEASSQKSVVRIKQDQSNCQLRVFGDSLSITIFRVPQASRLSKFTSKMLVVLFFKQLRHLGVSLSITIFSFQNPEYLKLPA